MSDTKHPMLSWADGVGISVKGLAAAAECSEPHLRNIFDGRKSASLGLAKRLSELSGGKVPMDAFLKPDAAEANP